MRISFISFRPNIRFSQKSSIEKTISNYLIAIKTVKKYVKSIIF